MALYKKGVKELLPPIVLRSEHPLKASKTKTLTMNHLLKSDPGRTSPKDPPRMESALIPPGVEPSPPQQPTSLPNKKASPAVLAVTCPLNNSNSKTITVGLDATTFIPILRIKSSSRQGHLVDLKVEEAIQLFHLFEDVGDIFEKLKTGPRELSSHLQSVPENFRISISSA